MLFAVATLFAFAAGSAEFSSPIASRMVGGTPTNINLVPWQAAIVSQSGGNFFIFCGGTIISSRHILSAAHCFYNVSALPVRWVRVGSSFVNSGGTLVQVAAALNHPEYNPVTYDRDISIVFLASGSFIGVDNVALLLLPKLDAALPVGTLVTVTGWGATRFRGPASNQLQRINVPVIDWNVCRNRYLEHRAIAGWQNVDITSNMFCAGWLDAGGQDACQGDSGGPAMADGIIFGIVSWGPDCAHHYWPGVYAFVSPSTKWIMDNAI